MKRFNQFLIEAPDLPDSLDHENQAKYHEDQRLAHDKLAVRHFHESNRRRGMGHPHAERWHAQVSEHHEDAAKAHTKLRDIHRALHKAKKEQE